MNFAKSRFFKVLKTTEKYLTKYEQKHVFIKDAADKISDGQFQALQEGDI